MIVHFALDSFNSIRLDNISLGNHDMQQAFNMRSYESDFNEVEDEDVYNLLLARDAKKSYWRWKDFFKVLILYKTSP